MSRQLASCWHATALLTSLARVPPNCTFEVDDFEDEWLYKKPFDYIHSRELEGCIANEDLFFQRAFEHLVPGGWFETQTCYVHLASDDDSRQRAPSVILWESNLIEGFNRFGKSLQSVATWKEKLTKAGFVDVHQEVRKVCATIRSRITIAWSTY